MRKPGQRYLIGYHSVVARMGATAAGQVERVAGNLLRIARARVGMSQRQLAQAAGVPQLTIARIESGARQPSLPLLTRILAAVDLEPRITLAPYDAHDDILDAANAELSDAEHAARLVTQDQFVAGSQPG